MEQPTKEIQIKKNLVTALAPWFDSLDNPARAQEKLLRHLLLMYGKTDYGKNHGAGKIRSIDEYRTGFPVITYADVAPMKTEIMRGEVGSFLSEPILAWAMTRGTTGRESKFIPVSTSDIADREKYGPRALLNYVYRTGNYRILRGFCMNQTFPSQVGSAPAGTTNVYYGYNSGVYARYATQKDHLRMVPSQDEIDALGGGL